MRPLRPLCLALATAFVVSGCGMFGDPVVASEDEAIEALLALRDGMQARMTADLTVDEDEVRAALRDDAEARELLTQEFGTDGDVETLLADLAEARTTLAEHALLLGTGADGSGRIAATWRGVVWVDLRGATDLAEGDDPADGFTVDLQARVDWPTVASLFEQPDLLGDLDDAAAEVAPFLGELPDTDAVERLVLGFLGSKLVGISGPVGPELFDDLGGATEDDPLGTASMTELDLDPREALATALTIDGFRRDGDDTVANVTLELRAIGELVLDRVAEAPDAVGMTFDDVDEARTELRELPERLTDVATLRFDADGAVSQVRTDVLDVVLQLARAAEPDATEVAAAERVAARLDATGLFVVLDVEQVGATPTVLGDPAVSVTPEQLAAAVGAAVLGGLQEGLGAFPEGFEDLPGTEAPAGGEPTDDPADDTTSGGEVAPSFGDEAIRPQELAVGDCFDDAALFGFAEDGADPTVPCDTEHDNEAFALVETTAETYDEMTRNEADAVRCIDLFEDYVGVPYAESELVVDVLRPSQTEFDAGARTSVCYLYGFDRLTGSMAGTGR